MGASRKTLEAIAEATAERRARERAQREERGRRASENTPEKPLTAKELSPHTRAQGSYVDGFMPDLSVQNQGKPRMVKVIRNLYPNIVDRWFAEGGPGFDEPQKRAVDHVRSLWACLGTEGRLTANYTGMSGGGGDGSENEVFAFAQLAHYKSEFMSYWDIFENIVRFEMPAGTAGSHLARNTPQAIASARACVGFIASKIAEARGY